MGASGPSTGESGLTNRAASAAPKNAAKRMAIAECARTFMNIAPTAAHTTPPITTRPLGPKNLMFEGTTMEANTSPASAPNAALGTPIIIGTNLGSMCPVSGSTMVATTPAVAPTNPQSTAHCKAVSRILPTVFNLSIVVCSEYTTHEGFRHLAGSRD